MPTPINHQFVSAKSDGPDNTLVRPSNWNANHAASGGAPGQAIGWDASASPENLSWVTLLRRNWVYNGDFESWPQGAPAGWNGSGAGATFSISGDQKLGNASASITRSGADCSLSQSLDLIAQFFRTVPHIVFWQGKTVTFGCWVKCSTAGVARIAIQDGAGTTHSSYHTGGGTYEFLKVTRTLDAGASKVQVFCIVDTGDAVALFDGAVLDICGGPELGDFIPTMVYQPKRAVITFGSASSQAQNTTEYHGPVGKSASEEHVSWLAPYNCIVHRLIGFLDTTPAAGQTVTLTVRTGGTTDTAITITITNADGVTKADLSNQIILGLQGQISIKSVLSATVGSRFVRGTVEIEEYPTSF